MAITQSSTLVAVFDTRGQAESAIDELWHAGFPHEQIGIAMPGGRVTEATTATERSEETAAEGAVAGSVVGGALGAIVGGLVAGLVPGIGPVVAGGILTGVVLGGAAGAAAGSYGGPFLALGLSDEEGKQVGQHLAAGRTVVVVRAGDRSDEAFQVLRSHGGRIGREPELVQSGRKS
jgi:hypothetical protein